MRQECQKEQKGIDSQETPRAGTIERAADAEAGVESNRPTGGARIKQGAANRDGTLGELEKVKTEGIKNFMAGRKEVAQKFYPNQDVAGKTEKTPAQEGSFFEKSQALGDAGGKTRREKLSVAKADESIFGGKEEISRINLRQKMRADPKIWREQKKAGLNLNYIERAKLEKEIFPSVLGGNISKTDLKWGVKKLGQKMLSTTDPKQHEKLRKEIKFLRKIGGIK